MFSKSCELIISILSKLANVSKVCNLGKSVPNIDGFIDETVNANKISVGDMNFPIL